MGRTRTTGPAATLAGARAPTLAAALARGLAAALAAVCACVATGCSSAPAVPTSHSSHTAHRSGTGATGTRTSPAADLRSLAASYLAIAEPANHKLDVEVAAYSANAHHDLAAAEAALRAQAGTERHFDRQLAAISFPPAIETTADALIRVNEIRARLTLRQAAAPSIRALLAFSGTHRAADAEIEAQVRLIRAELRLPPPESS